MHLEHTGLLGEGLAMNIPAAGHCTIGLYFSRFLQVQSRKPSLPHQRPVSQVAYRNKPIEEPVAWYGPIVMNTQAELQQAVAELRDGTFIKPG
jgi:hypothetical protein